LLLIYIENKEALSGVRKGFKGAYKNINKYYFLDLK